MKPVGFPEQNTVFAKDQPEYVPLPASFAAVQKYAPNAVENRSI